MNDTGFRKKSRRWRIRISLGVVVLGLVILILGIDPALFSVDRSPVVGFVQIAVFLVGLAMICLGGYTALNSLWNGTEKTIAADIGFRLVATGYVIAVTSGMADVFGVGNQPLPAIPYFGPLQASGVIFAEALIILGFLLLIRIPHKKP